jgi:putative holliday junction resolvase
MNESINPHDDLHSILKYGDRILGIDVGTKTFGLAIATLGLNIPTPLNVIVRQKYKTDILKMRDVIKQWDIKGLVIGLPLNMDGTSGVRVQSTKTIARNIAKDTGLPYCFCDERLSTSEATNRLIALNIRPSDRKNVIDSHAAVIILESYFGRIKNIDRE